LGVVFPDRFRTNSEKRDQSRQAFLRTSGLVALAGVSGGLLAACGGGSSVMVPGSGAKNALAPTSFDRLFKYKSRLTVSESVGHRTSVIQPICTTDTCGGDGGGDVGGSGGTYFKATASDGSWTSANLTTDTTVAVDSSSTQMANLSITQATSQADFNVPYTSTYSNGASMTRTVATDGSVSGTLLDQNGQTWSLNAVFTDYQVTINYSGPLSGSVTVTIDDVNYSAKTRTLHGCSKQTKEGTARVGSAFDVAGVFLLAIGLVPAAAVVGAIGAGLAVYSTFC